MSFVRYIGRIKTPAPSIESERNPKYIMGKKERKDMPLLPGKKNIGKNIETEEHEHPEMKHDQAVAIALNTARKSGAHISKKHHSKGHHASSHHRHKEHR